MKARLLVTALAVLVAGGCAGDREGVDRGARETERRSLAVAQAPQARLLAFAAAESEGKLVVVDVARRRVTGRLSVGAGPHNVTSSADGRFVLVTSPPAGRVTLVAGRTGRILHSFGGLRYPHDVKVHPAGRFAYVTERDRGALVVLDLQRRRIAARLEIGGEPHDVALGPRGRRAWVTFDPGEARIAVVDLSRPGRPALAGRIPGRIGTPHDLAFAGSDRVWVTFWGSGTVGLFAARSGTLLRRVPIGVEPHHLGVDAAGRRVWITDNGSSRATILDARSGRIVRRVPVGPRPHHVALGSGTAVVASNAGGFVSLHATGGRSLARIPAGAGLHGIALAGDVD